jgi:hypothetical protein
MTPPTWLNDQSKAIFTEAIQAEYPFDEVEFLLQEDENSDEIADGVDIVGRVLNRGAVTFSAKEPHAAQFEAPLRMATAFREAFPET